ncbi:MAG TPA: DUF3892 domain-containing protein [Aggregatilinea sp.]|uniref:DUF3892 domain-containing protein n=1 Tax=Aggregatilinea sp. TaxID=2806333 RepID=UPI002B6A6AC3|nr:DUF3892 domain-containing protein [Aggregatilinea sp.]HML23354.1 DUF3892 domain-containing protein [Aggregatilinea sp.]
MAKWADYGISAVRYNNARTHIDLLMVHVDNGDTIAIGKEWKRSDVVLEIERKRTFVTIPKNNDEKYIRGEDVRIVVINGVKYLRTDNNNTPSDNLGSLPEF